jgi:hypothetical protein
MPSYIRQSHRLLPPEPLVVMQPKFTRPSEPTWSCKQVTPTRYESLFCSDNLGSRDHRGEKRCITPSLTGSTGYLGRLEKRTSLYARRADQTGIRCPRNGTDTPGCSHCTTPARSHVLSSDLPWSLPIPSPFRRTPRRVRRDSCIRDNAQSSAGCLRPSAPRLRLL